MTRRSIKFDCHYCLNSVTAWQDECGREFPCPHCQTVLIVPSQPIDANLFDDIFESLNPTQSAAPASAAATPEFVAPSPVLENAIIDSTARRIASERVLPKCEVPETAPKTGAPQAAIAKAANPKAAIPKAAIPQANPTTATRQTPVTQANPETVSSKNANEPVREAIAEIKPAELEGPQQNVMERLLDEAADLRTTSSGEQRAEVSGEHDLLPLLEETLPEPDITDVPLKIDGWDFEQAAEVISLKCKICDSRIHTEASKLDTEISCPVCYTKILVTRAMIDKLAPSNRENPRDTKMSYNTSGKQTQSSGVDGDIPLIPLDVETKAADSGAAMISRIGKVDGSSKSAGGQTSPNQRGSGVAPMPAVSNQDAMPKPAGKPLSRREKYEAAQRRLAGLDGPRRAKKSSPHPQDLKIESDAEQAHPSRSEQGTARIIDAPVIDYSWARFGAMLNSPGLAWRAAVAAVVIGIGSGMMHRISRQYSEIAEPTMPDWFLNTLAWAGMGLVPYFIGVGLLWLLCGFVFREAAAGKGQVSDWSIRSFSELKSTFLVFGFSFFIAGLPISPIPMMFPFVHPLRCLIAPLFLLSAWYNQNALAIVAVDAFKFFQREKNEWGKFFSLAMGMGVIGFIGGMLMWQSFSFPIFTFITSLVGAVMVTLGTVLFASAAGWHCGWVVAGTSGTISAKPIS